jgi:hypothetical protein
VTEVMTATTSPGGRLVEKFLEQWETGPGRPGRSFVTMVQAMSSSPEAARSLREFLVDRVFAQLPGADEAMRWRMVTVSAELFGLAWNRYVVRAEPLASTPLAEVAERVGPAVQRLMFGTEVES